MSSWPWDCGSWLQAVEAAVKRPVVPERLEWLTRSCWGNSSRNFGTEMVPVSYGAGKERVKQDRVIGVLLVLIGWVLLYVHRNRRLIRDSGKPRTATSTFTRLRECIEIWRLTRAVLTKLATNLAGWLGLDSCVVSSDEVIPPGRRNSVS